MTEVAVRGAVSADAPAIAALEAAALGVDAWSPGLVADGVAAQVPTVSYLVAIGENADRPLLGYAVVSAAGDDAELQRIAVAAPARRHGVGRRLLGAVQDHARAHAARRLLLEVREDNDGALRFYTAAGFTELGRRPRYYRDGTTAVILELALGAQPDRPLTSLGREQ